jgi:hypothetical protein
MYSIFVSLFFFLELVLSYLSVSGFSLCVSGSVVSLSGQTYGLQDKVLEDSPQYYELGYHNQFVVSEWISLQTCKLE